MRLMQGRRGVKAVVTALPAFAWVAALAAMADAARAQLDEPFPSVFELSILLPEHGGDGALGLVLSGIDQDDQSGCSVARGGDVNGDGLSDVVVGAFFADPGGRDAAGETYAVLGRTSPFPAAIALSSLDGATGFRLDGIDDNDRSGTSVASAGDVNGDGVDDLIVGAPNANPGGLDYAGECYVVFGRKTPFPASIKLSSLNGTTGFRLDGVDFFDDTGQSVAPAGDVNGDGVDDLIIGAPYAYSEGRIQAGQSYIVFGRKTPFPASIKLSSLNGSTGFALGGIAQSDWSGWSVAAAGDVNGDNLSDVIIGAHPASPGGRFNAGQCYVVFGSTAPFPAFMSLASLDGTNGFRLDGIDKSDFCGFSVASAGDVNGDGMDDVLIGAPWAAPGGRSQAGESYVVFGYAGPFPPSIELSTLDGASGFRLDGIHESDQSGRAVSAAGDLNGDGVDDLVIGARYADPGGRDRAGESYVVYGHTTAFPASIELSALDGTTGFRLDGADAIDQSGVSISAAGDVNGDGAADLLIGALGASPDGRAGAGETYIVFGRHGSCAPDLDGNGTLDLFDFLAFVNLFNQGDPAADCDGNGPLDLFDFLCFVNEFNEGC